uniref:CUE domain-containing protein n=1 Tax=Leersia perrieri TaxID=77586 RepID=A0A0D9X6J8_9ORYZ
MSAVAVCGKRASSSSPFFEAATAAGSPPAAKRARCGGSPSPSWSRLVSRADLFANLSAQFPDMSLELIEKALDESGNDLESAIKSLLNLHLESVQNNCAPACEPIQVTTEVPVSAQDGGRVPSDNIPCSENLPSNGSEWVELLVNEMASASNIDDAKSRASRVLEVFEKAAVSNVNAQGLHDIQKENAVLKGQMESLAKENIILRRAFAVQRERQKDYDVKTQELQLERQNVAQFKEQVRNLELENYRLSVLLRQAQQGCSIQGRFNPDVF